MSEGPDKTPPQSVLQKPQQPAGAGQSILQKPKQSRLKKPGSEASAAGGAADVVFVLDRSESMAKIFDSVATWLAEFSQSAKREAPEALSLRFGFLGEDTSGFVHLAEWFVEDASRFSSAVSGLGLGHGDEVTLPAIDRAAGFPWLDGAHRCIVVLTDEPISGGFRPDWQREGAPQLKERLLELKIKLFVVAPDCSTFASFNGLPHFRYDRIKRRDDLFGRGLLEDLMSSVGKEVSHLSRLKAGAGKTSVTPIYDCTSVLGSFKDESV